MPKHGSESFFVLGEGLLGGDARRPELGPLGAAAEAQVAAVSLLADGTEGDQSPAQRGEPEELGNAMPRAAAGRLEIPAGFTYLGQFIDHDLTFDKTDVMLGENVSPARAPAGAARRASISTRSTAPGPTDPDSAMFYEADGST